MARAVAMLVIIALAGCAGGPARHADRNQEYARNCGYAMDQLGLCEDRP